MKYVGSKNRISKEILPIMLAGSKNYKNWIEPFVGGANMIDKVPNSFRKIGYDKHKYLIALLKAVQQGKTLPDNVSESDYYMIKSMPEAYPDYIVGFVGFCCSFSGKWWGGYARGKTNSGFDRNYCLESKKNLLKQAESIKNITFYSSSFEEIELPIEKSIFYCDPPYKNTVKYNHEIDYNKFYEWCFLLKEKGHKVYISEYSMPKEFKSIWEKEVVSNLDLNTGAKREIEKLYTL